MELKLGVQVLESYKRLSYKVWYALAEFIDNSTQSYDNNKSELDSAYEREGDMLQVDITYSNGSKPFIKIEDNSFGMDETDLQRALIIGMKPPVVNGRSKYGLGLKTASFWFGNKWEIVTKKLGHEYEYKVTVDLQEILQNAQKKPLLKTQKNLVDIKKKKVGINKHYTIILITKLNRAIHPTTARRTKDYLRSIYRYDILNQRLLLKFQGVKLSWSGDEFQNRMLRDENNSPYYRKFNFSINKKKVYGWAGVLEKGSRRDAGFSLLQANRVIKGWPEAYRPEKLFGEQEGGTNNLVNQRLVGEIFLDDFEVSHTKDEIFFHGDEEERLDLLLFKEFADFKKLAETYRKPQNEITISETVDIKAIVNDIFAKFQSQKFTDIVKHTPILPEDIFKINAEKYIEKAKKENINYESVIAGIRVNVVVNSEGSIFDPYLIVRTHAKKDHLTIVINKNHRHWISLSSSDLIVYFIKQCIYDGLAEWKGAFIEKSLTPDSIKMIKDLYLNYEIEFD